MVLSGEPQDYRQPGLSRLVFGLGAGVSVSRMLVDAGLWRDMCGRDRFLLVRTGWSVEALQSGRSLLRLTQFEYQRQLAPDWSVIAYSQFAVPYH